MCLWLTLPAVGPALSLFSSLSNNSIIATRPLFVAAPLEDISVLGFFCSVFPKAMAANSADLVNIQLVQGVEVVVESGLGDCGEESMP